jgi:hypothetical protein
MQKMPHCAPENTNHHIAGDSQLTFTLKCLLFKFYILHLQRKSVFSRSEEHNVSLTSPASPIAHSTQVHQASALFQVLREVGGWEAVRLGR